MLASCASPAPITPGGAAVREPVEHASADDCAVIAAIGAKELHWDAANAPSAALYPSFDRAEGGSYLEDCPWQKLGLAAPQIGTSSSPLGFFITRPVYSGSRAKASYEYSAAAIRSAGGSTIPPFVERENCTLVKDAGGWRLISCDLASAT